MGTFGSKGLLGHLWYRISVRSVYFSFYSICISFQIYLTHYFTSEAKPGIYANGLESIWNCIWPVFFTCPLYSGKSRVVTLVKPKWKDDGNPWVGPAEHATEVVVGKSKMTFRLNDEDELVGFHSKMRFPYRRIQNSDSTVQCPMCQQIQLICTKSIFCIQVQESSRMERKRLN